MNCSTAPVRFQLLDGNVGWFPNVSQAKSNVIYDVYGLRLNNREEPKLDNRAVTPFLPPANLAIDCAHSQWFACGVEKSDGELHPVLLHFDGCHPCLTDMRPRVARGHLLHRPIAVAATGHRLAVVDRGASGQHRIWIWAMPAGKLAGFIELAVDDIPHAIAFSAWQELVVSIQRHTGNCVPKALLLRFDLVGRFRGTIDIPDPSQSLVRLCIAKDGALWGAAADALTGPFDLWRVWLGDQAINCQCESEVAFSIQQMNDTAFYHSAAEQLNKAIRRTALVSVEQSNFCINEQSLVDEPSNLCFAWMVCAVQLQESALQIERRQRRESSYRYRSIVTFLAASGIVSG